MLLDLAVRQKHAPLQAYTIADRDIRTDRDVGTDLAILPDLRGWVDHHIASVYKGLARRGKLFRAFLRQRRQIQTSAGQEILRLTNVHPEALEIEAVQLPVSDYCRESLLLD